MFDTSADEAGQSPANHQLSEAGLYLEVAAPNINESLLVSAYDIHHRLIPDVDAFSGDFLQSIYGNPALLIIDSGGYEQRAGYDEDDVYHYPEGERFSADSYANLLAGFSPDARAIVVNPDNSGAPYHDQISAAQEFFAGVPTHLGNDFLIKPDGPNDVPSFIRVDALSASANQLRQFDVVGVTEKELGSTVERRMQSLAQLRLVMDDHDVTAPIHVFGALDPIMTPIYFLCGGEIFDGLTWLRYWFCDGRALYAPSYAALTDSFTLRRLQWQSKMHSANLDYLQSMSNQMRVFATDYEYSAFEANFAIVEAAYARLRTLEGRA